MFENEILPLATRLSDLGRQTKIARHILEKDYILSWVLAGISSVKELQEHLVFKGGTCLKKCYFGDYRFSEDLDFSTIGNCPTGKHLESLMKEAAEKATMLLSEAIGNAEILCEAYNEKQPHPEGQEAFTMKARLPYQREHLVRALVEVTTNENVLGSIEQKQILHLYGEKMTALIPSYSLNEIIAEKVCAILGNSIKIHERSWHRSRARDYYDLWRIFRDFDHEINKEALAPLIQRKSILKGLTFTTKEDLFQEAYITEIKSTWVEWLGPLVPNLPSSDIVINDLRGLVDKASLL